MKLPYRKNILVPKEKLTKYLLSETHPVGSSKARFFRGLGFNDSNMDILVLSFKGIGSTCEVDHTKNCPMALTML